MKKNILLEVNKLAKEFPYEKSFFGKVKKSVKAVDKISFDLKEGETLAIVGESGCGKSTVAKIILGLVKQDSGEVIISENGNRKESLKERSKFIQMIFQDPYSSLDPSMKIKDIMSEGMLYHKLVTKEAAEAKTIELLKLSGLNEDVLERYAREFSGGQRQRIAIARALSLNPKIIIADEAVSSLDVSMQAQIINLMIKLQQEQGLSYIFISHDLNVVKYVASRVAVMYFGSIVEIGDKSKMYKTPKHPYTKALIESVPITHPKERGKKVLLKGELVSKIDKHEGCKFYSRCQYAKEICKLEEPKLKEVEKDYFVACHLVDRLES
ncbi:MAG: ABC transporter ATP-binding protein [Sarcina sp.]